MSISLTATRHPKGLPDLSIPIAGQEFFRRHWLPPARELGLSLILQFESPGLPVIDDQVPTTTERELIDQELRRLLDWVEAAGLGVEVAAHMSSRIAALMAALREAPEAGYMRVFIG